MISAIVVAAGKSSRMGTTDKLDLPFQGSTVLNTVLDNIIQSKVDEVILVVSNKAPKLSDDVKKNWRIIINESRDQGLTSSIQKGVMAAQEDSHLLICLGDMPLINQGDYNALTSKIINSNEKSIIQPWRDGRPGNPVLFSHHFRNEILKLSYAHGCKPIVKNNHDYLHTLETKNAAYFTDIDTEEEYREIIKNWP